jgi:hypothetical protein
MRSSAGSPFATPAFDDYALIDGVGLTGIAA